jgi:hypothetical protein
MNTSTITVPMMCAALHQMRWINDVLRIERSDKSTFKPYKDLRGMYFLGRKPDLPMRFRTFRLECPECGSKPPFPGEVSPSE